MFYEQEFATPGDAVLAHHGVKGMRWGVRSAVDSTKDAARSAGAKTASGYNKSVEGTKNATKAVGAKTASGYNKSVEGTKNATKAAASKTAGAYNKSVEGTKNAARTTANKTSASVKGKANAVAANGTVKDINREIQGAKWGTRQAYIEKTLGDAERLNSIAKGTAGIDSKAFATKDLVFTKRQAKFVEPILENHVARLKSGKLKTRDLFLLSARMRRRDLTIGVDLAGKKKKAAEKRGREVNFDIPKVKKG